ncbi:hypothetical protein RchiOBHm_Chr6g0286231 [Rosa chinensis]|uniref:Major facilitator, sugar transporter, major facilitator superfamily n=1 Tax=Rosa chinensis TaxID=74649 RepID=A0A2P6PUS3_ROSCH|nr:hypothetical protein RchiOBHm_Chr6g0286231 [Rosa chinensis]
MGSRQSSMMGSSQVMRDSSISVVACVLIVALGPIQFGFTQSSLILDSQLFSFWFFIKCGCHGGAIASGQISEYIGRKGSLMIATIPNVIG